MPNGGGWYWARGQQHVGPMSIEQLASEIRSAPTGDRTLIYGPGVSSWTPARDVSSVAERLGGSAGSAAPPPPPTYTVSRSDVIDYEIFGNEMQYVEVTLDPGEMAIADA